MACTLFNDVILFISNQNHYSEITNIIDLQTELFMGIFT